MSITKFIFDWTTPDPHLYKDESESLHPAPRPSHQHPWPSVKNGAALSDFPVHLLGAGIVSPNFADVRISPIQGGGQQNNNQLAGNRNTVAPSWTAVSSCLPCTQRNSKTILSARQLNATWRKTNRSDIVVILQNRNNN